MSLEPSLCLLFFIENSDNPWRSIGFFMTDELTKRLDLTHRAGETKCVENGSNGCLLLDGCRVIEKSLEKALRLMQTGPQFN